MISDCCHFFPALMYLPLVGSSPQAVLFYVALFGGAFIILSRSEVQKKTSGVTDWEGKGGEDEKPHLRLHIQGLKRTGNQRRGGAVKLLIAFSCGPSNIRNKISICSE